MKLVLAVLLAVIWTVAPRAQAQSISCYNFGITNISVPPELKIAYSCDVVDSASQSLSFPVVTSSAQVPKIPRAMVITLSGFDPSDAIAVQFNVRDSQTNVAVGYSLGFGSYAFWPTVTNADGSQTVSMAVSGWPPGFTLEVVQYHSFAGFETVNVGIWLVE